MAKLLERRREGEVVVVEELVVRFYMFRDKSKDSRGNFGLKMASENIGFLFCQKNFLRGENMLP